MSAGALTQERFDEDMQKAIDEGFTIIQGTEDLLLLDLDDDEALATYEARLPDIQKVVMFEEEKRWRSKSGVGWHVVLKLLMPIEDAAARVALQACLGSDPVREWLSIGRFLNDIKEPSRLFQPGDAKVQTRQTDPDTMEF